MEREERKDQSSRRWGKTLADYEHKSLHGNLTDALRADYDKAVNQVPLYLDALRADGKKLAKVRTGSKEKFITLKEFEELVDGFTARFYRIQREYERQRKEKLIHEQKRRGRAY